uniref:Centrosomal protein of 72 kDa n=1 Tax=Sphenodon punctatus TaxID=8508 RepID=A0A8D0G841_SPHPU
QVPSRRLLPSDVRSLSLPGTYHEKITHLGNSLNNFTCLKSLDLSRNALVSLEGIQHLSCLEKLNLYYNQISSLSEVFRLHSLITLKDVDFRLNPVVKNESDYRLFVVHMLPNLRRLDDRPVRDGERKASLLHFTVDHAFESHDSPTAAKGGEAERYGHLRKPRVEYINSMSKKCSVMDEDDEAVLNLIAKCEWELSKPPGITGSSKKNPEVKFHNLQTQAGPLLSAMQKSTLTDQQKDSIEVHQELDNLLLEKKALKNTLSEQDQKYSIRINNLMSEMSSTKKEKVSRVVRIFSFRDSRITLVSTNEHLLQELTETRKRHKAEVEQLHWSYNQLKKTMGRISPSSLDNSRC